MRLNRQTASQKQIKTCPDLVGDLSKSFIFNGEIFFDLEGEGAPSKDDCTLFSEIFTIRPIGDLDDFQVLKVHLKSGVLRACDGEEEGQDNIHLLSFAGVQLTEMFRAEDLGASMALSETNEGTNYPGVYVYVVPQGMTYRGYLKALSEKKAEQESSAETQTQTTQSRPAWAGRRQPRWGNR